MQTDLIDVFAPYPGVVTEVEDDWYITESMLVDNQFTASVPLNLEGLVEENNIVITVELLNEDLMVLDQLFLNFAGNEIILPPQCQWQGSLYQGNGHWLPPITGDFLLQRKAIQVKFWVEAAVRSEVSIKIFEIGADQFGGRTFGDLVMTVPSNEIVSKNCGKFSQISEGTVTGTYFKYKMKAKALTSSLKEDQAYIMALMVGDSLLMFSEDQPATVEFIIADGAMTKGGMKETMGNSPKRLSSNRVLNED